MVTICPQELRGQCSNKSCTYQHLKRFEAPKTRALAIIASLKPYFSASDWRSAEKIIISSKLAIHEGKNLDDIVSSLISSLCPVPSKAPFSSISKTSQD